MRVRVNSEEKSLEDACTVQELILKLELNPKTLVVERNGEILPADAFATTCLAEGDRLELLHFVGGG